MKAIIVDDEESARDVLSNLINHFCTNVQIVACCKNLPEAVEAIKKHQPDVVFLDIEMPHYAGYEIVHFFDKIDFEIIFITAYDQYAIRAFEIAAIDYLLKPVNIDRLILSLKRVEEIKRWEMNTEKLNLLNSTIENEVLKKIVVIDKGQQEIININAIIAIEAKEAYSIIHTTSKQFWASKNLKHFENILESANQFIRVHKSWIVNKDNIQKYSKSEHTILLTNNITAKLSRYKTATFESSILN